MRVLLDNHVLLWWLHDATRFRLATHAADAQLAAYGIECLPA